jgi:glycosyltransferase involved in cell wall biosynthesis
VLGGGTINGVDAIGRFNPANLAPNVRHQIRTAHGIPEHALVVGFVGRVVRDKGMADLVDAWAALRARFPSLHLLVVGPLESGDPIPEDTRRVLTTDTRIHLTGLEWDTPPLYAAMDLVVLPSYREGFPTVPLEAAAMELPVVSTRVPGCVDAVLEGRTGMLAEPHHVATLTELIAGYLSDPDLRRRHGQAGREWVLRDFKQEVIWQAVWGEYVRLLNEVGMPLQAPAYPHDKLAIPHLAPEGS